MNITIITLFPEMFEGPFAHSIVKRAVQNEKTVISFVPLRNFAADAYGSVDDHPYGGGQGMILRVDVMDRAISHARTLASARAHVVLLDAQGQPYTQRKAVELSGKPHLILICGHYEGYDERIRQLVDEEISIGDYILTGGEIPAMVLTDSIVRLLPGVLKKEHATTDESFSESEGLLEHPQYTRPEAYNGQRVPDVLLSGNHKEIASWRAAQAKKRTTERRPDIASESSKD